MTFKYVPVNNWLIVWRASDIAVFSCVCFFFLIKFLLESFLMYSLRLKNVSKHKMYEIFSIAFFLSFLTQFSPFFLIAWHKLLLHVFFYFSPSEILIAFSCYFFLNISFLFLTHTRAHTSFDVMSNSNFKK
jgi:hypothetical protein